MKIMRHDEFLIHQRRAKFASDRYDFRRLPVEGTAAFGGRNRLADIVGYVALAIGFATLTYMLGRVIFAHIGG